MTVGTLWVNDVDRTPLSEWSLSFETRSDGVGQMTVVIQDRTNDPILEYGRNREIITYEVGGRVRWQGEIVQSKLDLPVGMPWRRWTLTCTDWNTLLDTRLVGCPNGQSWVSEDGGITYTAIDPNAPNGGEDQATIGQWFSAYVRTPDGRAFDTITYVGNFIANEILNDPYSGQPRVQPQNATLRAALDMMRAYGDRPIFYWISAPATRTSVPFVHWSVFPPVIP